jgi:putative GTP pyrophosphokinase
MTWPTPNHSKEQINKAGRILADGIKAPEQLDIDQFFWEFNVVNNWWSCHGYPINTFQSTLRQKLQTIEPNAIVAQRLKRMPSIIAKLRRFNSMRLARMQDIGGLRAVVSNLTKVRSLESHYDNRRLKHELVVFRDYTTSPKSSGYRSIHRIYKYKNSRAPEYNEIFVELQIRTRLQHAWATAVETMGTFLNHALKSSEGPETWLDFFSLTSSAFAHLEETSPVPGYENLAPKETFSALIEKAHTLDVREKLLAFSVAVKRVYADRGSGKYHLIILNPNERRVTIRTYSQSNLDAASQEYSEAEREIANGKPMQAVLVSDGPIKELRHAYPNYFLDTREFIRKLDGIEKLL